MHVGGGRKDEECVPCLKDTETGEIKETVVFRIESRSFLKKFNEKNGWEINWIKIPKEVEVFALALKENNEIQGLIGVRNDVDVKAAYLHWACLNLLELGRYAERVGKEIDELTADEILQFKIP